MAETWRLAGTVYVACNCGYGCPCNYNALPTHGFCEGGWTWRIDSGSFDGTALDGLAFSIFVKWPGAIHEGDGEGVFVVDERADGAQREAIATLVGGDHGGPWGVLAWTWPKRHDTLALAYDVTLDGIHSRATADDVLAFESTLIKNPVSGADVHPGVVLPEGIIVKTADLGQSTVFRVSRGIPMDHSGKYSAVGGFSYSNP
jgi:hypothetical protein